jgi:hypothetical protein
MKAHYFDAATGLWLGVSIDAPEDVVELNRPAGAMVVAEALQYPHAKRLVAGSLVDYQPPAPDADHEWLDDVKRWRIKPDALARKNAREDAKTQIEALERQQARAIREHAINRGGTPAQLKKRLEDIDDQITALRAQLNET